MDIDLETPAMLLEGVEVIVRADTLREAIIEALRLSPNRFSRATIIAGPTGVRYGPEQIRALAGMHNLGAGREEETNPYPPVAGGRT